LKCHFFFQRDWSLCTNDLSASVGIAPSASLQLSGSTLVDLLVLRAGVTLQGQFGKLRRKQERKGLFSEQCSFQNKGAAVVPSAFVHGTACGAGVAATLNKSGDSGLLQGYYQWRKCKFLFFDCHWEAQNVKNFWEHTGFFFACFLFGSVCSLILFSRRHPLAVHVVQQHFYYLGLIVKIKLSFDFEMENKNCKFFFLLLFIIVIKMAFFWAGAQTHKVPMALHALNRTRLSSRLQEIGAKGVVLLQGAPTAMRFDTDHEMFASMLPTFFFGFFFLILFFSRTRIVLSVGVRC
jgi:hypothetical protein